VKSWRAVAVLLLCLALVGSMACRAFGGGRNIGVSNEARLVFGFTKIGVA